MKRKKFKYGLLAFDRRVLDTKVKVRAQAVHWAGYEKEPDAYTYFDLYQMLKSNKSLGFSDIADQLILVPATEEQIGFMNSTATLVYDKAEDPDDDDFEVCSDCKGECEVDGANCKTCSSQGYVYLKPAQEERQ